MEKMNDLRDLLKHEIQDLYSVEEQIIAAMPNMIEKASNAELKRSLQEHLAITEQQKTRLDGVMKAFGEQKEEESAGLLSRLFKTKMVCKGMQGIITEGNQILSANMNPDVMDAAIIACAQKIEHYEICGYGTAKAFARELNLTEVERLLDQTLNEEYNADDRLTALAVGRLNKEAESPSKKSNGASNGGSRTTAGSSGNTRSTTQRVPQEAMEMEMASSDKTRSASRGSGSPAKGTSAPKGSAGGRTAAGNTRTDSPAASKTAGSRSTAKASTKSAGSNSGSKSAASAGKTGGRGATGSSRTR